MRSGFEFGMVIVAPLSLAACGGGTPQEEPTDAQAAAPQAGAPQVAGAAGSPPAAFAQCRSCHSVEPGRNMIGPSLHGVFGKAAASVPGFAYSKALQDAKLTWDEPTLHAWLENPAKLVPGNKMVFVGQRDPARRKEVIDYLATLK